MPRDYAERSRRFRGRGRGRGRRQPATWSWFFAGLLSGILLSGFLWLASLPPAETAAAGGDAAAPAKPALQFDFYKVLPERDTGLDADDAPGSFDPPGSPSIPTRPHDAPARDASGSRDTPGSRDASRAPGSRASGDAPARAAPGTTPAVDSPDLDNTLYLIQAGAFRQPEDAERRRAQLLLLSLDAYVKKVSLESGDWYRIYVGPFDSKTRFAKARDLITREGIDIQLWRQAPE